MNAILHYRVNGSRLPKIIFMEKVTVTPPHIHIRRKTEEFILYFVLAGEMYLNEGDRRYALKANDLLILDPHQEHYGTKAAACTYFYIHFAHDQMEELAKHEEIVKNELIIERLTALKTHECKSGENASSHLAVPKLFHSKPNSTVVSLLHKLREAHHNRLEHFQLMTGTLLLELLITLSREFTASFLFSEHSVSKTRSTRMIHDLLSYFQNDYASDIRGATIEDRYNCNFDYLNRMFKKATDTTIFAYLNELRISKAKQMLYDGSGTLSEISEKCGFKDVYYFSKVFKKYTGLTPGVYSKNRRW